MIGMNQSVRNWIVSGMGNCQGWCRRFVERVTTGTQVIGGGDRILLTFIVNILREASCVTGGQDGLPLGTPFSHF